MSGRTGVLGGTFDPPHIGHIVVARDAYEWLNLDRVLVVPSARPPHRTAVFGAEDRLRMTRAAFAGDDRFMVCDVEVRRPGPSYTVHTLEWARRTFDPHDLYLLMGADQYGALESWHQPDRIEELATLAVMTRPGEESALRSGRFAFVTVPVTRVDLSSTRIRERLAAGLSVRYLVPEAINELVVELWAGLPPQASTARVTRQATEQSQVGRMEASREC